MKILSFLNLLDQSKKLSITNLTLYLILGKITYSPFDWSSAISLFVVCLSYAHKRHVNNQFTQNQTNAESSLEATFTDIKSKIEKLESNVSSLEVRTAFKK